MSFLHTSLCAVLAFLVCAPVSSRPPSPGLFTHLLHSQLVHTPRFHTTPSHHTHTLSHTTLSSTTLSHTTFVSHTVGYWLVDFLSDVDVVTKCPESPSKSSTRKSCKSETVKTFLHIPKPDLACQVHITEYHSRLRWLQNYDIPCSPLHHEC